MPLEDALYDAVKEEVKQSGMKLKGWVSHALAGAVAAGRERRARGGAAVEMPPVAAPSEKVRYVPMEEA